MVKQEKTSNVGPFDIGLENDLQANERRDILFESIEDSRTGRRGYITQWYGNREGMDYIVVQNESQYPVRVRSDGGTSQLVPSATSNTITGVGPEGGGSIEDDVSYSFIEIEEVTGNIIDQDDITILVGNLSRPEESNQDVQRGFDPALLIPGVFRNGQ